MLFRSFALQWTLSWFLLLLANYFGAFRDTYFWDQGAYNFVKERFKDWHNVKVLELSCLIAGQKKAGSKIRLFCHLMTTGIT